MNGETENDELFSLIDAEGNVFDVPKRHARAYVEEGGVVPATPEEVRQYDLRKSVQGGGATIEALGRGLAESATFGLSEHLLHEYGADAERTQALHQEQSGARATGEVLGMLAPGGAGKGILKLGQAAGQKAGAAVARQAVRPQFVRAADLAARGATEGALFEASRASTEAAINDEFSAEQALSMVGYGALFGAGTELGLSGAGWLGKKALQKGSAGAKKALASADESVRKNFGVLADRSYGDVALESAKTAWFKAAGVATGKGEDTIRRMWNSREIAGPAGNEIRNSATKVTKKTFDDIRRSYRRVAALEPPTRAPSADPAAARQSNRVFSGELLRDAKRLRELPVRGADKKRATDVASEFEAAAKGIGADDLTKARRVAEKARGAMERLAKEAPAGVNDIARGAARRLDEHLKNETVWGAAALDEKLGESTKESLRAVVDELETRLTSPGIRTALGKEAGADAGKVKKFIESFGDARVQAETDALFDSLRRNKALLQDELSLSTGAARENYQAALNATEAMERQLGAVREAVQAEALFRSVEAKQWGEYAPMIAGFLTGSPAVGLATAVVTRPAEAMHTFVAAKHLVDKALKSDTLIASRIRGLVRPKKKDAVRGAKRRAVPRSSIALAARAAHISDEKQAEQRQHRRDEYIRIAAAVRGTVASPQTAMRHLGAGLAQLSNESPVQAMTVMDRALRTAQYLHDRVLPKDFTSPFMPPTMLHPSDTDMDRMRAILRVLESPELLFDDVETGVVDPDAVQALRELRPGTYARMQEHFLRELSQASEMPPYSLLVNMSEAFGVPLHPSLAPDTVAFMQQMHAPETDSQAAPSPPRNKIRLSGAHATSTQSAQDRMLGMGS